MFVMQPSSSTTKQIYALNKHPGCLSQGLLDEDFGEKLAEGHLTVCSRSQQT